MQVLQDLGSSDADGTAAVFAVGTQTSVVEASLSRRGVDGDGTAADFACGTPASVGEAPVGRGGV